MPKETKNIPTKILQDLTKALWALNKSRAIRIYNNPWKLLWYNFLIGVARGLGSIIGATLVLGIIVYILSKFLYVPVLGDIINVIFSLSKGSTN
ncbi:MAG TPA: hypothetical protein ENJ78_01165 [candidate division WWE3 bacterium]|uniref:AI-2E family transporter n=1 Tax=candidate division WWE3 bacterium TaxID=2053526 RepID=A0A7V5MHP3_UNCKA|nr:hypothetical protein [candidate division WWE3 bacterium]